MILDAGDFEELKTKGEPIIPLKNGQTNQEMGWLRLWENHNNGTIDRLLHLWISNPDIGLDSNLISAFGKDEKAFPHLTCHYVSSPGGINSFHIDLLSRVDEILHPEYVDKVYRPLSPAFHEAKDIIGMWQRTSEHQYLMSGWGLFGDQVARKPFGKIQPILEKYTQHYADLAKNDFSYDNVDIETLALRSKRQIGEIFNRKTDPDSYQIMDALVGSSMTDRINNLHIHGASESPEAYQANTYTHKESILFLN